MNQAHFIGRLTKNPEYRNTPNGVAVCTFTVAVPKRRDREQANFIQVVTWRGLADNCNQYLRQGKQVGVSGEITSRSYDDDNGKRHYVTEIVADTVDFLSPKEEEGFFPGETAEPEPDVDPLFGPPTPYKPKQVVRTRKG